jgi:hypothetical protein
MLAVVHPRAGHDGDGTCLGLRTYRVQRALLSSTSIRTSHTTLHHTTSFQPTTLAKHTHTQSVKNEIVKAKRAITEAKKKTKAAYSGMFSKV